MNVFDKLLSDKPHEKGKVITQPILLSDCPSVVTIDEKDKYNIEIEKGDYLVVRMGFTANKAGANFTHPNIAATAKTIHEFKHYRQGGSKFWTSRAGIDHYFVVPRNKILLIPEKGYSYIKAEINGIKVSFNVSGGGGGGWTDYLNTSTTISVNHKLSDLKKIAEVAVRNSPFEPITPEGLEKGYEEKWLRLAAKATPKIKDKIAEMIEEGKKPIIHLIAGYSCDGETSGVASGVERRYKKIPLPNDDEGRTCYKLEQLGAPRSFILNVGWGGVRAKINHIDWHKTAVANNLA